jgi:hypothetical protein
LALTSIKQNQLFYTIGSTLPVSSNAKSVTSDAVFHLTSKEKNFDIIPASSFVDGNVNLTLHGQLKESGNYSLVSDKSTLDALSFNYNKQESSFSFLSPEALTDELDDAGLDNCTVYSTKGKSLTQTVSEENTGVSLWKTFVWLALLFLLVEVLLLSKFKLQTIQNIFQKRAV